MVEQLQYCVLKGFFCTFLLEINLLLFFRGQDQNDIIVQDHCNSTGCSWEITSNKTSERGSINICKGYVSATFFQEAVLEIAPLCFDVITRCMRILCFNLPFIQ